MKISPLLGAVNFLNIGRPGGTRESDRLNRDGENGRDQYTRQQKDDSDEPGKKDEDPRQKQQKMSEAVEAFHTDPHAQASGLSATTEGEGPGLKVVVKDSSGGIVRQFTGEEFLRLRESVAPGKKSRGKLLDQKF